MSFLRKIEDKLENIYEEWSGKLFKGPIKPSEIANKAVRTMVKNKKISINKNYAPNDYQVYLSKDDFLQTQPIFDALSEEISETLLANATEKNLTIIGKPRVIFEIDSGLSQGQVRIKTNYLEVKEDIEPDDGFKIPLEDTLTFSKKEINYTLVQNDWSFHVIQGPSEGKKFRIPNGLLTIGRKPENDIVLNDTCISRIHARVKLQNGKLTITDLDSTNGVFVNGLQTKECQLSVGDEVVLGQTKFLVAKE